MDMDGEAEENSRRVQVRFVTKLKPPLKVPPSSIAIPSNLTRLGLSTVVNNLLQAGTVALLIFLRILKWSMICEWKSDFLYVALFGSRKSWLESWALWFSDWWRAGADVAWKVSSCQGHFGGTCLPLFSLLLSQGWWKFLFLKELDLTALVCAMLVVLGMFKGVFSCSGSDKYVGFVDFYEMSIALGLVWAHHL